MSPADPISTSNRKHGRQGVSWTQEADPAYKRLHQSFEALENVQNILEKASICHDKLKIFVYKAVA